MKAIAKIYEDEASKYPFFVYYPGDTGTVVLLLDDTGKGICVSGSRVGDYKPGMGAGSGWRTDNCIPFHGEIVIEK